MPMMFALGQHPAPEWVATRLLPNERLYAFLQSAQAEGELRIFLGLRWCLRRVDIEEGL